MIILPQKSYVSKLIEAEIQTISDGNSITSNVSRIKTFSKSHVGKLMRLLQTRFALAFSIIYIATQIAGAVQDSKDIIRVVKLINQVIRKAKLNDVRLSYGGIPGFVPISQCENKLDLCGVRIFTFSDAGFATSKGDKSLGACLILRGRETSRDGSINCMGPIIDSYSRCISRCARSTLAAEAVACANSIEVGLWRRTLITELVFGFFMGGLPAISDPFRLRNPFELSTEDALINELEPTLDSNDLNYSLGSRQWFVDREKYIDTSEGQFISR